MISLITESYCSMILGMWQLTPLNKNLDPRFKTWGKKTEGHKLTQSSRSRLHFLGMLIRSPSLSQGLALWTPTNMTMRGKENSKRIDLHEDRTTEDQLMEWDIVMSHSVSCSIFEKIDPSRVSFFPPCHVGRISQNKTSRQWWWMNQRSTEVHPGSWRLY